MTRNLVSMPKELKPSVEMASSPNERWQKTAWSKRPILTKTSLTFHTSMLGFYSGVGT
jgi:hypothetical protein